MQYNDKFVLENKEIGGKRMSIVIKGLELKQVPIKPKEIAFDKDGKSVVYLDPQGKRIKKIQVTASEYRWTNEDGTIYSGKAYKSIKGKPIKEFAKTTLINKFDEVPVSDLTYYIQNEHTYLIVNSELKAQLIESKKALVFNYVIRGFKVYKAAIYFDEQLQRVLMRCFRGDLRQAELNEQETKEIKTTVDDGVEALDLDSLGV